MERSEVEELHYITHLQNLGSIIRRGLLSHRRAQAHDPISVANPSVQAVRSSKEVPGGRRLHEYVNLYISARNAMLFSILGFPMAPPPRHLDIAVIGVDAAVMDRPGVVIADGNAAASLTGFWPSPEGLQKVNRALVFSRFWTDPDPAMATIKREAMMAEVLVPDDVGPQYLRRFYVCCPTALSAAQNLGLGTRFEINRDLFFNDAVRSHG